MTTNDVAKLRTELSWSSDVDPAEIERCIERMDCVDCGIVHFVRINARALSLGPPQCIADRIERDHMGAHSGLRPEEAALRFQREQRAFHERQVAARDWSIRLREMRRRL